MMDNERRADIGHIAVWEGARETRVNLEEDASTCVTDVLAYIAHFCDRLGLDPEAEFRSAIESYLGDYEDGPKAERTLDPEDDLPEP
jgi:hypothetical protein